MELQAACVQCRPGRSWACSGGTEPAGMSAFEFMSSQVRTIRGPAEEPRFSIARGAKS